MKTFQLRLISLRRNSNAGRRSSWRESPNLRHPRGLSRFVSIREWRVRISWRSRGHCGTQGRGECSPTRAAVPTGPQLALGRGLDPRALSNPTWLFSREIRRTRNPSEKARQKWKTGRARIGVNR